MKQVAVLRVTQQRTYKRSPLVNSQPETEALSLAYMEPVDANNRVWNQILPELILR